MACLYAFKIRSGVAKEDTNRSNWSGEGENSSQLVNDLPAVTRLNKQDVSENTNLVSRHHMLLIPSF